MGAGMKRIRWMARVTLKSDSVGQCGGQGKMMFVVDRVDADKMRTGILHVRDSAHENDSKRTFGLFSKVQIKYIFVEINYIREYSIFKVLSTHFQPVLKITGSYSLL